MFITSFLIVEKENSFFAISLSASSGFIQSLKALNLEIFS
jgi:hypothetical protein